MSDNDTGIYVLICFVASQVDGFENAGLKCSYDDSARMVITLDEALEQYSLLAVMLRD